MKLNKNYYGHIEHELFNYKNNKQELEELTDEIINSSPLQSGNRVQTSTLSDETGSKALKLISNARIKRLEDTIRSIDTAIRILKSDAEPGKYKLLEMKYFECQYTDKRIAEELCISMETYYRWKRQIVSLVAMYMGLA